MIVGDGRESRRTRSARARLPLTASVRLAEKTRIGRRSRGVVSLVSDSEERDVPAHSAYGKVLST